MKEWNLMAIINMEDEIQGNPDEPEEMKRQNREPTNY